MVEQSGAPVQGVDMNWLQFQYQSQQQPIYIAQLIMSGQAPRPMMQPMVQPVIPVYQPVYQMPQQQPAKGGGSVFLNIFMGIVGFAAIVGIIVWGLTLLAKKNVQPGGPTVTIDSGDYVQPNPEDLTKKGLPTNGNYPYWPLVIENGMDIQQDVIIGKVTNYSDQPMKNVWIKFILFKKQDKNAVQVGTTNDHIDVVQPGATWEFRAKVAVNYDTTRVDDLTHSN